MTANKANKKQAREDKRTTVSLAQVVWDMAEERMSDKGFNDNFSSYIADLIRRDKEAAEEKNLRKLELEAKTKKEKTAPPKGKSGVNNQDDAKNQSGDEQPKEIQN